MGYIYFVQAGDTQGPIKIGFSANVTNRLRQFQTLSPEKLTLIHQRPGILSDEKRLHIQFKEHRLRGEWFKPHQSIFEFTNNPDAVIEAKAPKQRIKSTGGDKYTLQQTADDEFILYEGDKELATIYCTQPIAMLIDNALNQTSRAGSVTSQAKRDASKRNIAKRWERWQVVP